MPLVPVSIKNLYHSGLVFLIRDYTRGSGASLGVPVISGVPHLCVRSILWESKTSCLFLHSGKYGFTRITRFQKYSHYQFQEATKMLTCFFLKRGLKHDIMRKYEKNAYSTFYCHSSTIHVL